MNHEHHPLYVAAGGGGDALGALMVALSQGADPARTHIATFAWERKRFDPQPGPRGAADFTGLREPCADVAQVTSATRLRRGRSFLPDLVRETGCQLYLLDPTGGVRSLRRQIVSLSSHLQSRETRLVDVGGDILARGGEQGLRSPTADAMALAAAADTGIRTWIFTLGLGLDGELTRRQWRAACRDGALAGDGHAEDSRQLEPGAAAFVQQLLAWHPSEVAGLACLAALGYRGTAEVRADGLLVSLSPEAAALHRFEHGWVMARNRVAQAVSDTRSLADVERAVQETVGRSELQDERVMLARRSHYNTSRLDQHELREFESRLLSYSVEAARRRVSFITLRRVSELLSLSPRPFAQFSRYLANRHPGRLDPPVWRCSGGGGPRAPAGAEPSAGGRPRL